MMNTRLGVSLVLALALLSPPQELGAQIGGLIKRKAAEAVKGGDKKETPAKVDDQASQSKLPRKLTSVVLTSFKRGLEAERDHRQATVKFLASIKTREQYNACQQTVATSPEMQKILTSIGNLPDNATPEQMQKASLKMQEDMAKLLAQKCGEDPGQYHDGWRREQVVAAEAAGIKVFAAGLEATSGGGGPFLSLEPGPEDDAYFYRLLKEWIVPFCRLPAAAQDEAAAKGVSIPGSMKGMFYVYTAAEAAQLKAVCPGLLQLMDAIQ